MSLRKNAPNWANRLFIIICSLIVIGLLFTALQVLVRQSGLVVNAQEGPTVDVIPNHGEGDDGEPDNDTTPIDDEDGQDGEGTGGDIGDEDDGEPDNDTTPVDDEDGQDGEGTGGDTGDGDDGDPDNDTTPVDDEDGDDGDPADDETPVEDDDIVSAGITTTVYFPTVAKPLPVPALTASRPNSANAWTVSWTISDATGILSYVLEESQDADFETISQSYTVAAPTLVQNISKPASPNNSYYYRVRAVSAVTSSGWSNVDVAHGAYHDTFDDFSTGWAKRRFTFLEETNVYYGTNNEAGQLVVITADRWDWVLGSPLRHAPVVPYEIEYRMRVHDPSNLVSGGAIVGGDWTGEACPETTFPELYNTNHCFNSFYNFNMIFFGPMKLLFEQVDFIDYCPNCGGSQLKRLGATTTVENISGLENPATDWHNFRIEVRNDGLRFYVDDRFVRHFTDTSHIHQPYFGVFSSTDEYKPSIYLYEYYSVTPLD